MLYDEFREDLSELWTFVDYDVVEGLVCKLDQRRIYTSQNASVVESGSNRSEENRVVSLKIFNAVFMVK